MIIKKLTTKQELFESGKVGAICFHERIDDMEGAKSWWENCDIEDFGALNDEGHVIAHMHNHKHTMYVDGNEVSHCGIGGVSTLPEYRNTGAIRKIFEMLIPEEYKQGHVISTLYPFDFKFYRKFGYEQCSYGYEYSFKPDILKEYKFDGEAIMWQDGDSVKEYLELYSIYAKHYNLAVKRDEEKMKSHIKGDVFKKRRFSYLLKQNGKAIAYVLFKDEYHDDDAIMHAKELVWIDKEGFNAILGFLARFSADYGRIKIWLPSNIDLHSVIHTSKGYHVEKEPRIDYMIRIINVKRMLEVMSKPDNCNVNILVHDELIKENNACFKVTNDKVIITNEEADLDLDIRPLSVLASGGMSLDAASLRDDVKVLNKFDMLDLLFKRRGISITQHF